MPPAPPLPPLPPGRVGPALDSVPPIEMVHALFRKTKMGSFFNNPVDPPEFLRLAFPLPEDLRCVSSIEKEVADRQVPSLPDILAVDLGR